jgi:amino acid adenylation domain-containing protein
LATYNIKAIYPLSPLQEGILFHSIEASQPGVYFNQYTAEFDRPLDEGRLRSAWEAVVARHDVLRTSFTWERRDKPLQIVRGEVAVPWQALDWREATSAEQSLRYASLLARDRDRGFELDHAPLLRFTLIRLQDTRYRFVCSFHHIVLDGWSLRLLQAEALRIYEQPAAADSLPALRPYSDFIEWLGEQDLSGAREHWTALLQTFVEPTPLPFAGRQALSGEHRRRQELTLPLSLSEDLRRMARGQRVTLNNVVTAAWALLLARHADHEEVVFGTTLSGRPVDLEGSDRMTGLFINTLPMRIRLAEQQSCASLLHDVQAQQQAMRRFEQTPLASVAKWSGVPPGRSMFDTLVVFEGVPGRPADEAPALEAHDEEYLDYSNYPLALLAHPGDRLKLFAVVDARRYDCASAERLLEQLGAILAAFAADPAQRLRNVSVLPAAERARIVEHWNHTRAPFPSHAAVQELFEACVARSPQAPAIVFEETVLAYGELEARANQLAHALRQRGVGREVCVPVFMERSADAIVAILAVLKAGGAYVPIDAAFPRHRLELVLDDLTAAGIGKLQRPLVVTRNALAEALAGAPVDLMRIDGDAEAIARCSVARLGAVNAADDLAYVMYTSGSTGRPKGVQISHRNLINSTLARPHYYKEPLSAFLLLSSLATDSSVAGVFWSLCTGAALLVPRARQEQDIEGLCALARRGRVSHLLAVPSLYRIVLEHGGMAAAETLRAVIVAGESCAEDIVEEHRLRMPRAALYNEYGPTEGTVWATVARLDDRPGGVTIGKPVANARIYIVDKAMRAVPVGVAGELCIAGAGVGRGYLARPEETAAKFVPEPHGDARARMYRTGDRACYLESGDIEFLGRIDHQLKINGYRVEPEEIEAALTSHPAIAEAAALLHVDAKSDATDGELEQLLAALAALDPRSAEALLRDVEKLH